VSEVFIDVADLNLNDPEGETWDGEGGIDLPDPGEYLLRVTDAEFTVSAANNKCLKETVEVAALPNGDSTDQKGKTIMQWRALTQKAAPRFRSYMKAVGVAPDNSGRLNLNDFVGRTYVAVVSHEPYNKPQPDGSIREFTNARITRERSASHSV